MAHRFLRRTASRLWKGSSHSRLSLSPRFASSGSSAISPLSPSSIASLLSPENIDLVRKERNFLSDLYDKLVEMGYDRSEEDLKLIADTRARIDELFTVVVVGEFNSGKSSFINCLVGKKICEEGVIPTTSKICIIRSNSHTGGGGENFEWRKAANILLEDVEEMEVDIDWLRYISIVDTPGTNAIIKSHEMLTQQIVPRSDLILFITSAERPMTDSEANFLQKIKQWGKKVVIVINKMDIIGTAEEKTRVIDYVSQNVAQIMLQKSTNTIPVFAISTRLATSAKNVVSKGHDPALGVAATSWHESNFATLDTFLRSNLGESSLIKQKLENPLTVSDRVITNALKVLDERTAAVESDFRLLELIDENMSVFKADIARDTRYFKTHIDSLCEQLAKRGKLFLENNISLFQPALLLDNERFTQEFNTKVVMDLKRPLDDIATELSDLISQRARTQARHVIEFVSLRPRTATKSMVGNVSHFDAEFDKVRFELIEKLKRDTANVLEAHDTKKETDRIAQQLKQSGLMTAALTTTSAATLGGLIAANMMDVTGIVAVSSLSLLALSIIPRQKSSVMNAFDKRIASLKTQLDTVVSNQLDKELHSCSEKIMSSIGPFRRFVVVERKKIAELTDKMKALKVVARDLRQQIRD